MTDTPKPIYLAEGESDVVKLGQRGIAATTRVHVDGNPTLSEYGHTPAMQELMNETPVFVDALAAVAHWGRPDAAAHFIELHDITDLHHVEAFIENYGFAA